MKQIEIEYFWPLTQQIPLDLDLPRSISTYIPSMPAGTSLYVGDYGTSSTFTTGKLSVDIGSTVFRVDKKPNIIRRALYNVLGIKWEKK